MIVQSLRCDATERIPEAMAALAANATRAVPSGVCWHYCRPPAVRLELELEQRALAREVIGAVKQG
jgi:hypothetical protein